MDVMSLDEFNLLTIEEQDRLWQLYISDCAEGKVKTSMSDFLIWLDERD